VYSGAPGHGNTLPEVIVEGRRQLTVWRDWAAKQQSNGGDGNDWTDFGKGVRGPALIASGSEIIPKNSKLAKSIWSESRWIKGSTPNTSLPSLVSRRFLNGKPPVSWLPKAISFGGQLGRVISRANIALGIILTGYDLYTDYQLYQEDPVEYWRQARQNATTIGMYHNQ
jgi:hypothetical protein